MSGVSSGLPLRNLFIQVTIVQKPYCLCYSCYILIDAIWTKFLCSNPAFAVSLVIGVTGGWGGERGLRPPQSGDPSRAWVLRGLDEECCHIVSYIDCMKLYYLYDLVLWGKISRQSLGFGCLKLRCFRTPGLSTRWLHTDSTPHPKTCESLILHYVYIYIYIYVYIVY